VPEDADLLHIDMRTMRALARLGIDDLPGRLGTQPVLFSPAAASRLTGLSAKAIRAAVDRGELPSTGRSHRWVPLSALRRITGGEH
jgi:hypothetical protein